MTKSCWEGSKPKLFPGLTWIISFRSIGCSMLLKNCLLRPWCWKSATRVICMPSHPTIRITVFELDEFSPPHQVGSLSSLFYDSIARTHWELHKKAAFKSTHTNRHKKRWIFLCYVLFPRSGVLIPGPLSVLAALIRICLNSMQSSSGSSMAIVLLNIASAAFREGQSRGARSLENARERTLNRSPRLTKASITMDEP